MWQVEDELQQLHGPEANAIETIGRPDERTQALHHSVRERAGYVSVGSAVNART
jgi:hypothetical protein